MNARNLHGHVTQELGVRIVSGALRPGDALPREEVLAEQMAVSRTALREAMRVLSAKGLVEARPKVGTRVREERYWQQLDADVLAWRCASMPTADFVQKLAEMREIFEPPWPRAVAMPTSSSTLNRPIAPWPRRAIATSGRKPIWSFTKPCCSPRITN
jgi:DNA-binding FadR family transcriptional regulator